ncbi:MAG: helix-turn-helix transcriptional regulator [Kiritimatiellae bacterium]|nr:helix-turn-helix transcriptional regulator [Kiritimatiellia bacterium]
MADRLETWDRLAIARNNKGLSQAALAEKLGMSQQKYHPYEHGREMKSGMIVQVCAILECSPSWLLGVAEEGQQLPPDSPLLMRLKAAFEQLNPTGQTKVVDYAEDLTGNETYAVVSLPGAPEDQSRLAPADVA